MINYRLQPACANCRHLFRRYNYAAEDRDRYYCTQGAPPRPISLSPLMPGEEWQPAMQNVMTREQAWQAWAEWARGREVQEHGICDAWKGSVEPSDPDSPGYSAHMAEQEETGDYYSTQ